MEDMTYIIELVPKGFEDAKKAITTIKSFNLVTVHQEVERLLSNCKPYFLFKDGTEIVTDNDLQEYYVEASRGYIRISVVSEKHANFMRTTKFYSAPKTNMSYDYWQPCEASPYLSCAAMLQKSKEMWPLLPPTSRFDSETNNKLDAITKMNMIQNDIMARAQRREGPSRIPAPEVEWQLRDMQRQFSRIEKNVDMLMKAKEETERRNKQLASEEKILEALNVKLIGLKKDRNLSEKSKEEPEKTKKFEHNAVCDICDSVIIGHRYKCYYCADFDLCRDCEGRGEHSHHALVRIVDKSTRVPEKSRNRHRHLFRASDDLTKGLFHKGLLAANTYLDSLAFGGVQGTGQENKNEKKPTTTPSEGFRPYQKKATSTSNAETLKDSMEYLKDFQEKALSALDEYYLKSVKPVPARQEVVAEVKVDESPKPVMKHIDIPLFKPIVPAWQNTVGEANVDQKPKMERPLIEFVYNGQVLKQDDDSISTHSSFESLDDLENILDEEIKEAKRAEPVTDEDEGLRTAVENTPISEEDDGIHTAVAPTPIAEEDDGLYTAVAPTPVPEEEDGLHTAVPPTPVPEERFEELSRPMLPVLEQNHAYDLLFSRLLDMGFDFEHVSKAINACGTDIDRCLQYLLH